MNLRRLCDNRLFEAIFFIAIPVISGAVCLIIGRSLISRDWQLVYRQPSYKPPEWAVVLIWLAGALVLSGFILLHIWRARNSSFRIVPILYPLIAYAVQHILTMIYLLFYMGLTSPLVAALINLAHCIVVLVVIVLLWRWNFRKASLMFIVYWLWLLYCAVFTWGAFHKFLYTPSAAAALLAANQQHNGTNITVLDDNGSVVQYIIANDTTTTTTLLPVLASDALPTTSAEFSTTTANSTLITDSTTTSTTTSTTAPILIIHGSPDGSRGVGRAVEITPPILVGGRHPVNTRGVNVSISGNATDIDLGNHVHVVVPNDVHTHNETVEITPTDTESQPVPGG